jgi:hypothetical protein
MSEDVFLLWGGGVQMCKERVRMGDEIELCADKGWRSNINVILTGDDDDDPGTRQLHIS